MFLKCYYEATYFTWGVAISMVILAFTPSKSIALLDTHIYVFLHNVMPFVTFQLYFAFMLSQRSACHLV